jgi:hypothetical protein
VGGWKSYAGAALILYSAYLGGSADCIDIECTRQVTQLYKAGEGLVSVGLAHKLAKFTTALTGMLGPVAGSAQKIPDNPLNK